MGRDYKCLRTLMVVDPDRLSERVGQESLVVCGSPRGMTSLVAYALYECGYHLGDRIGAKNLEDQEILERLPAADSPENAASITSSDELSSIFNQRNARHERWGFKIPHSAAYVHQLESMLRRPVFVVCVRNPVAIAHSVIKREPDMTFTAERLFEISERPLRVINHLMEMQESTFIMVDMDAVTRSPGVFLEEITGLLNIQGDLTRIKKAISTPGYKRPSEREGVTLQAQ